MSAGMSTYDTDQPWVVYHYGRTSDRFWPPWKSNRVLGRAAIDCQCAICGVTERVWVKIPRFGPVDRYDKHPARIRFLLTHLHEDRPPMMAWALPLLNPAAGPVDLDALAMRLQADLMSAENRDSSAGEGAQR